LNDYDKYEDEYIIGLNDSLTFLYYSLAKYEKALDIQDRMLELREKLFGKEVNEYAKSLNLKAVIFKELGKDNEALKLHYQSIRIRETKQELKKDLAVSYGNISIIYYIEKNYQLSITFMKKSLEIDEKMLNYNHPDIASSYNNISLIYQGLKESDIALEYINKSIKIREKILDKYHPSLASSYGNISTFYRDLKKLKEALSYSKKSLVIFENILDKKHPNLATCYNNIAHMYKDLKECQKAKDYMGKAKNIFSLYEYKNKEMYNANQFI
jgi:tetratricopeptide (TPR) repeat protein